MFARIARVVGKLFTVVDDTKPSNRVRLACEGLEDRATPALFFVNTAADFDDQVLGDGKAGRWIVDARIGQYFATSLRSTVQEGNALAVAGKDSDHTVGFNMKAIASSTIELKNGPLQDLIADYKFSGPGASALTITKPAADLFRLFTVGLDKTVSISNLGLTNGNSSDSGGAIFNEGYLTVDGCYIASNQAKDGGGGIDSGGWELRIKNSTICYNGTPGSGGGISASAAKVVEISDTAVVSNGAGVNGGGIDVMSCVLNLSNVTVAMNSAGTHGGGIAVVEGKLVMNGGEVANNTAGDYGGGVYLANLQGSNSTMDKVSVTGNHTAGKGGGFYVLTGVLTFSNGKALSGNSAALGFDGGAYKPPPFANVILVAPLVTFQGIGQDP
jgi:hypothetical protein